MKVVAQIALCRCMSVAVLTVALVLPIHAMTTKADGTPPSVDELTVQDSAKDCDAIGWAWSDEEQFDQNPNQYRACEGPFAMRVRCVDQGTDGRGRLRILCEVEVRNTAVNPSRTFQRDGVLRLFSDDGAQYVNDRTLVEKAHVGQPLALDLLTQGAQVISGFVGFRVPREATVTPMRLVLIHWYAADGPKPFADLGGRGALVIVLDDVPWRASRRQAGSSPTSSPAHATSETPPGNESTPEAEATISALQTQVAVLSTASTRTADGDATMTPTATSSDGATLPTNSPTPEPTSTRPAVPTLTPIPQPTNTPAPASKYPPAVASLVREDSTTACDRIGWQFESQATLEADVNHFAACTGSLVYLARCVNDFPIPSVTLYQPSPSEQWIACFVRVGNFGNGDATVSGYDMNLVSASNGRYSQSFEAAVTLFDASATLDFATLPSGQHVDGWIAFEVPRSIEMPARIEVDPPLFGDESERAVIIIERFGSVNDDL